MKTSFMTMTMYLTGLAAVFASADGPASTTTGAASVTGATLAVGATTEYNCLDSSDSSMGVSFVKVRRTDPIFPAARWTSPQRGHGDAIFRAKARRGTKAER